MKTYFDALVDMTKNNKIHSLPQLRKHLCFTLQIEFGFSENQAEIVWENALKYTRKKPCLVHCGDHWHQYDSRFEAIIREAENYGHKAVERRVQYGNTC